MRPRYGTHPPVLLHARPAPARVRVVCYFFFFVTAVKTRRNEESAMAGNGNRTEGAAVGPPTRFGPALPSVLLPRPSRGGQWSRSHRHGDGGARPPQGSERCASTGRMRWRALLIAALVLVCGLSAWLAGGTGVGVSLWGTRVSPASRPPFPSTRGQPHAITRPGTTRVATATPRPAGARPRLRCVRPRGG